MTPRCARPMPRYERLRPGGSRRACSRRARSGGDVPDLETGGSVALRTGRESTCVDLPVRPARRSAEVIPTSSIAMATFDPEAALFASSGRVDPSPDPRILGLHRLRRRLRGERSERDPPAAGRRSAVRLRRERRARRLLPELRAGARPRSARRPLRRAGRPGRPLVPAQDRASRGQAGRRPGSPARRHRRPPDRRAGGGAVSDVLPASPSHLRRPVQPLPRQQPHRRVDAVPAQPAGHRPAVSAGVRGRLPRPLARSGGAGAGPSRLRARAAARLRPARGERPRQRGPASPPMRELFDALRPLAARWGRYGATALLEQPLRRLRCSSRNDGRAAPGPVAGGHVAAVDGPHRRSLDLLRELRIVVDHYREDRADRRRREGVEPVLFSGRARGPCGTNQRGH